MGYNYVFKDILQPVKTAHNCIGDSHVTLEWGSVYAGTALEGIDNTIQIFILNVHLSYFLGPIKKE